MLNVDLETAKTSKLKDREQATSEGTAEQTSKKSGSNTQPADADGNPDNAQDNRTESELAIVKPSEKTSGMATTPTSGKSEIGHSLSDRSGSQSLIPCRMISTLWAKASARSGSTWS